MKIEVTSVGSTVTVGTIDSQAKSADGAVVIGTVMYEQTADATHPGLVSTGTQSIAGAKTFTGAISASNLSGTNTGDQTITLTGDVTGSGTGSFATTVAKVAGTTVSGTTGTSNVVFSSAPTLTNPVVGTQSQGDTSTKAASTAYVDTAVANAVAGVNPAVAVQAATTAAGNTSGFTYNNGASGVGATFTGTVNTAITIDGYTFTALGQRLLVKNDTQSPSGAFNGIYYITQVQTGILAPILTRALDYNTPSDMNNTGAIPVINGTANGTTSWVLTSAVTAVGTDALTFTEFTRNPADYLLKANNLSDVSTRQTALNTLTGTQSSGSYLRSDGTNASITAIQAGDVPTLNQNTTGSAAKLTTARAINGTDFDGSAAITVTAAANTLTGTTLASGVVTSSLTTVGTIGTGVWSGTAVAATKGGTGLASGTSGGILGFTSTTTVASSALLAANQLVLGGGAGATPATQGSNGTVGQTLIAAGGTAAPTWGTVSQRNLLVNGFFDYWQAGTSVVSTAAGGATPTNVYAYQADQWYTRNVLGGGTIEGQITFAQETSGADNSIFDATVTITRAPTGTGIQNGCEIWQVLSNVQTMALYNQNSVFQCNVSSLGNVNQIGIQFFYATSEAKPSVANNIGAEQTFSVTTYTSCVTTAQAMGTNMTRAGVVAVRIRITGVSSGNMYDLNNGFAIARCCWTQGDVAPAVPQRQYNDPVAERDACYYFYELLGGNTANESIGMAYSGGTTTGLTALVYTTTKRVTPTITFSNVVKFRYSNAANNFVATNMGATNVTIKSALITLTTSGIASGSLAGYINTVDTTGTIAIDARI